MIDNCATGNIAGIKFITMVTMEAELPFFDSLLDNNIGLIKFTSIVSTVIYFQNSNTICNCYTINVTYKNKCFSVWFRYVESNAY